ncbi:MAG: NAD(P)-binding domain-containing protein [Ignavibacteriaceae bacterium]|nr:NAD(P)-binding domain-containing protein [Ignavibacteriaceae bacterium]
MKIAIIGAGNVGGALAKGFADAGHTVIIGARDVNSDDVKSLLAQSPAISATSISEAINLAETVVISTPPDAAVKIAQDNPALKYKTVIDATNSVFRNPEPYKTAFEGIKAVTGCENVVKCFNTTGFENMANPRYGDIGIDMFMAGSSAEAKSVARKLSLDIGFEECYDFGGDDKAALLEQFAMSWINLAIMQKHGRGIAFKLIRR